jgi:hypothetical protein
MRSLRATFTNPDTSTSEVFNFGDRDNSGASSYTVNCHSVPISTTVSLYNVKEGGAGITGFNFQDTSGNTYLPCTAGQTCDTYYSEM